MSYDYWRIIFNNNNENTIFNDYRVHVYLVPFVHKTWWFIFVGCLVLMRKVKKVTHKYAERHSSLPLSRTQIYWAKLNHKKGV